VARGPDVFAVGAAAGLRPSAGPRAHVEAERVATGVRRLLTGHARPGAAKVAFARVSVQQLTADS
jgi:hypothetical protein